MGDGPKPLEYSLRSRGIWDKKDRCIFCDKDVTNFSRHLFRIHAKESRVILIMQEPIKSLKRRIMIDALRKEGNFKLFEEKQIIRPKQRAAGSNGVANKKDQFSNCPNCKGIYRMKTLHKHAKKCGNVN